MKRTYWVYIMASLTGTLYIGVTSTIFTRNSQHKNKHFEGFTAKYGCDRLVYFESFGDIRDAIQREKVLKGWRRSKKVTLVESVNPRWQDLAESWGRQMLFQNQTIRDPR
jgi:putative endonuclease